MSTEAHDESHWSIDCSDEEEYFEPCVHYRILNGSRIWEPNGDAITRLYEEIETKGFNKLEWQCPGRISPSQLKQESDSDHMCGPASEDNSDSGNNPQNKSTFDFDNDFDETTFGRSNTRVTTKRTQTVKKSQTNLSKVMFDIKKYQMIDHKSTKTKSNTFALIGENVPQVSNAITANNSNNIVEKTLEKNVNPSSIKSNNTSQLSTSEEFDFI